MSQPISPKPVSSHGEKELPAYVSNGLIGLRVRDIPLLAGMALVSGFAGHPERRVEAAATAPYPLAGDLAVNGVWMSDVFHQTCDLEQTYDFSAGELMSHFSLKASGVTITCEVLTFASREDPTLVCQEMSLIPSNDCVCKSRRCWMGLELLAGHSGTFATLLAKASRPAMERCCGRARVD